MALSTKDVVRIVKKVMAPFIRSVQLSITRCVLDSIDDSLGIQVAKVKLLDGEVKELERFQNYGFTSKPSGQAEGVCVFVGGNREHGICISLDNRTFRMKGLADGAVALYDETGTAVHLKNDGTIELGLGTFEKILKGETFQSFFNSHVHVGNLGVTTSAPVGPSTPLQLSQVVKAS